MGWGGCGGRKEQEKFKSMRSWPNPEEGDGKQNEANETHHFFKDNFWSLCSMGLQRPNLSLLLENDKVGVVQ